MSYIGKRDRLDDNSGYGPPQKRQQSYGGGPPQGYMGGGGGGLGGGGGGGSYDGYPSQSGMQQQQLPAQQQQRPPGHPEEKPGSVLLFTVFNPKYPITVDVMHTICTSSGATVNRIVIFRKNGVQAMVEFDSAEAAEAVKESLNGADIYSGCCTLKIDWGKPTTLTVTKNDQDSWDYTSPNLGREHSKPQPLLPDPKFGPGPGPYGDGMARQGPDYGYDDYRPPPQADPYDPYRRMPPAERYPSGPSGLPPRPPLHDPYRDSYGPPGYGNPRGPGPRPPYPGGPMPLRGGRPPMAEYDDGSRNSAMMQQGSVLKVYGLNNEKMNCQKLFNLFCLYGNVVRIKFLKSKDGVAMVQMGDYRSCEFAKKNLDGCFFFEKKLSISFSKEAFIQDVPNPVDLPDGTSSFKDFMGNRNNRFATQEAAAKNRIQATSKVLYFFNAPPGLQDFDIKQIFIDADATEPKKVKIFPPKSEKSSTGLIEWAKVGQCIEALVVANHIPLPNPNGKNPYIIKFNFSDVAIKERQQ